MALLIGVHPNNLHLSLARGWLEVFDAVGATLVPYSDGRDSAKLLTQGRIDVCGTGSTPPIIAQGFGLEVQYLAASAPRPANGGLVVPRSSPIIEAVGLKGKRVALLQGSFHSYLLARELEKVGLHLGDIECVELPPAASLLALEARQVEAWVAMAPLLDQSLSANRVRLLAPCGDTIPNRSVFWTARERAVSPALLDAFVGGLMRLGRAIAGEPQRAAALLAENGAKDVPFTTWCDVVAGRDWTVLPVDPAIVAEQQDEADTLFRHGELPHTIVMATARRFNPLADAGTAN